MIGKRVTSGEVVVGKRERKRGQNVTKPQASQVHMHGPGPVRKLGNWASALFSLRPADLTALG
jgi:hypothetical protein